MTCEHYKSPGSIKDCEKSTKFDVTTRYLGFTNCGAEPDLHTVDYL